MRLQATNTQSRIRYANGAFKIQRDTGSGTIYTHITVPDNTNGNTVFANKITADAFQTSSDERIKDNYEEITAEESWNIVEAVNPKNI